jgi:hypothetical protein
MRYLPVLLASVLAAGPTLDTRCQGLPDKGTTVGQVPPAVVAMTTSPVTRTRDGESTSTSQAKPARLRAALSGKDFMNKDFDARFLIAPTVLSLKHFGHVTAPVTLARDVSRVECLLKARSPDDSRPIVRIYVTEFDVPTHVYDIARNLVVQDTAEVAVDVRIPKGNYLVHVNYSDATDRNVRPALDICSVSFK